MDAKNNQWNNFSVCFEVLEREYQLAILMNSKCRFANNTAFIAVDEITIRETTGDGFCLNIKETQAPEIQETTSIELTTSVTTPNNLSK